jgi:hypothetical protein
MDLVNTYVNESMIKGYFGFVRGCYVANYTLIFLLNKIKESTKKTDKLDCIFIDYKSAYN